METIYFILGALSVVTLVAVLSVFTIKRELKEFSSRKVEDITRDFFERTDMLDRRVDQEIDRVNQLVERTHEYIDKATDRCSEDIQELYSYIDSRVDKLEARLESKFTDRERFVDGILESVDKMKKKIKERTV